MKKYLLNIPQYYYKGLIYKLLIATIGTAFTGVDLRISAVDKTTNICGY